MAAPTGRVRRSPSRPLRRAITLDQKEERRRDLMAAARKVFLRKPYHLVTIAEISKAARLSSGAFYWYFPSKEAIFLALMDEAAEGLRRYIEEAQDRAEPDASGPSMARLLAGVQATIEYFDKDKDGVRLFLRDAWGLNRSFERYIFDINERFVLENEAVIREGQALGMVADVPAHVLAFSMNACVGQIAHRRIVTDDGLTPAQVAEYVVKFILFGILTDPARAPIAAAIAATPPDGTTEAAPS